MSSLPIKNNSHTFIDYLAWGICGIVSAVFAIAIVINAGWGGGDDHENFFDTAMGHPKSLYAHICPSILRFWPLGRCDYNILTLFPGGETPTAHYLWNSLTFIVFITFFCCVLWKIIKENTHSRYAGLYLIAGAAVMFFSSSFCGIFTSIIFAERPLLLCLAIFTFFVWRAWKFDKTADYICALIAAIIGTYFKEPTFGALIVFAACQLFFGHRNMPIKRRYFCYTLLLNGLIFFILYYFMAYSPSNGESEYLQYQQAKSSGNRLTIFWKIISRQIILLPAVLFAMWRLWRMFVYKERQKLLYDSLLLAGVAYCFALIILRITETHYSLPAIALIIPPLIHFTTNLQFVENNNVIARWGGGGGLLWAILVFFNVSGLPLCGITMPGIIGNIKTVKNEWREHRTYMPKLKPIANYCATGKKVFDYSSENTPHEFDAFTNAALNFLLKKPDNSQNNLVQVSHVTPEMNRSSIILYRYRNSPMPKDLRIFLDKNNLAVIAFMHSSIFLGTPPLPPLPTGKYSFDREQILETGKFFASVGLDTPIPEGHWTNSDCVRIAWRLAENRGKPLKIRFDVKAASPRIQAMVTANGKFFGTWQNFNNGIAITLSELPNNSNIIEIEFQIINGMERIAKGIYEQRALLFRGVTFNWE